MRQDAENAQQSLGKTAYYDPAEKLIVLYVTNRHPKDVLRSFSHELVHHAQNCRGELDDLSTDAHYAKDGKGREIEEEAYLQGSLNLRDYEDSIKYDHEGVNEMKLTKSQLKGIIEQTVKNLISEKDADGDGSPAPPKWADPDDNDPKVKASLQKEQDGAMVIQAEETELSKEAQNILNMATDFLKNASKLDAKAFTKLIVQMAVERSEEMGDSLATPFGINLEEEDMDEISPVPTPIPNRDEDEEGEEQETPSGEGGSADKLKPTIKGKKIEIEKEKKTGDMVKYLMDKRKKETANSSLNVDENNETWYNSSIYESLKSKWTK